MKYAVSSCLLGVNCKYNGGNNASSELIDYLKEHEADVNAFLDAYKDSVEFVNSNVDAAAEIIGNHDIIPAEVAVKAIPQCSIVFMEGDDMQTILSGYLNTLNEQNPETIGGQLPDEDFYYKRG